MEGITFKIMGTEVIELLRKRTDEMIKDAEAQKRHLNLLRREAATEEGIARVERAVIDILEEVEGVKFLTRHVDPDQTFVVKTTHLRSLGIRIPFGIDD